MAIEEPEGWVRFRNVDDPDEVICFGMFDGTVEGLRQAAPPPAGPAWRPGRTFRSAS